jgi:class 3 adenylate cyclase
MKRKIAAIFAADIAGYGKLLAEDEEETLRRLASYRPVVDDFIARAGGRVFNTAGDAVLAEFSSAVEAVRCAIDIQESLRTRNMAYPASRQICFRIGITVGDVVERDGDLLGDGVNIAARLESIAPVGGICISRIVYEQVANKLSVQFADIGEQQVENIPTPVHAYRVAMRPDDPADNAKDKTKTLKRPKSVLVPSAIAAAFAVLLASGLAYSSFFRSSTSPRMTTQLMVQATSQPAPQQAPRAGEPLVPDTIPFIPDRSRTAVRDEYMSAADHKALAISNGPVGLSTGQADDATAKVVALDMCQRLADAQPQSRKCELYAVGNTVVDARAHPPMPSVPWVTHDPAIERPLVADEIPLLRDAAKTSIEHNYVPGSSPKALALAPSGGFFSFYGQQSDDEAIRRALEACGNNAGVPCMIVSVDGIFVVPVPTVMKVTGFFRAADADAIAPGLRNNVARRLGNGSGWTAVAVGTTGKAGIIVKADSEQAAINGAVADCARQDSSCRVIGIGPFAVEAK